MTGSESVDVHTLTGAYALDAVTDDIERRRFERHLGECEACAEEVRSLRETASRLAQPTAVSPPANLRERVMAQIRVTPQLPAQSLGPPAGEPVDQVLGELPGTGLDGATSRPAEMRPSAGRRVRGDQVPRVNRWLAIAASFLVVSGGTLAGVGFVQAERARQAQQRTEQILAIAADPAARRISGEVTGGGSATVVVAGSRAALLTEGLRPLADDRTYQLWLVRPNEIVSAGLGPSGSDAGGDWFRVLDGVRPGDQVAISVEPKGGSEQPTTEPLTAIAV